MYQRIPLDEFENIIDERILQRGWSYFNKHCVEDVVELEQGVYEAIVLGSEEYNVVLKVEHNTIVEHDCDCPYDMGPVCKHVVAVIFYLQENILSTLEVEDARMLTSEKKRQKSATQQVKEILTALSHEELKAFVMEAAKDDQQFRTFFLSTLGHLIGIPDKAFYKKQIQTILKQAVARDGFIYHHQAKGLAKNMQMFFRNVEDYLEQQQFLHAIYITAALLEELAAVLAYSDDGDGYLGGLLEDTFGLLQDIANADLPLEERSWVFKYALQVAKSGLLSGWHWQVNFIELAAVLISNEQELEVVFKALDQIKGEYIEERVQLVKLSLLEKYRSELEVRHFIQQNLHHSAIRKSEIEKALAKEDYNTALSLANDGYLQDKETKRGLSLMWYQYLLTIAEQQEDTIKIVEHARFLYFHNTNKSSYCYQLLKKHVLKEEWDAFVKGLLKTWKSNQKQFFGGEEQVRRIYIAEERWSDLLAWVKKQAFFHNIEENEAYLAPHYAEDLLLLYAKGITQHLKQNVNRAAYKLVCKYLRRMKKLGGGEMVEELIANFKVQYKSRRALHEELKQV